MQIEEVFHTIPLSVVKFDLPNWTRSNKNNRIAWHSMVWPTTDEEFEKPSDDTDGTVVIGQKHESLALEKLQTFGGL